MPCKGWFALLERYRAAVKVYNGAVEVLKSVSGIQFNISWYRAERARMEVEAARAFLLDHEHYHGCLIGEVVTNRESVTNGKPKPVRQSVEDWVLGDQGQSGG